MDEDVRRPPDSTADRDLGYVIANCLLSHADVEERADRPGAYHWRNIYPCMDTVTTMRYNSRGEFLAGAAVRRGRPLSSEKGQPWQELGQ